MKLKGIYLFILSQVLSVSSFHQTIIYAVFVCSYRPGTKMLEESFLLLFI